MSIYALKPKFQNLLRPLVRRLHARGTTANQVTVFACAISIALGITLACFPAHAALFLLLPLWFFLRMALNAMDGMLAREFGQKTALGGYLNEITDVVADAALYLPFAFVAPFDALSVGVFIYSHPPKASYGVASPRRTTAYCLRRRALSETFGGWLYLAALTEFCGVLGAVHGNGRRYDGPLGKSDRAFDIGCIAFYYALAGSLPDWLNTTLWLLNILLAATCVRRIRNGLNRRNP